MTEVRRRNGQKPAITSRLRGRTKLCLHCKTFKGLAQFYKSRKGIGGVQSYCKECRRLRYGDRDHAGIMRKWRKNNRARYLADHRVRQFNRKHAIKCVADGTVTPEFLEALYNEEVCSYCERDTPLSKRTADHRKAISRGGMHSAKNLIMACHPCNSSKRAMSEEDFRDYIRKNHSRLPRNIRASANHSAVEIS